MLAPGLWCTVYYAIKKSLILTVCELLHHHSSVHAQKFFKILFLYCFIIDIRNTGKRRSQLQYMLFKKRPVLRIRTYWILQKFDILKLLFIFETGSEWNKFVPDTLADMDK